MLCIHATCSNPLLKDKASIKYFVVIKLTQIKMMITNINPMMAKVDVELVTVMTGSVMILIPFEFAFSVLI